MGVLEQRKLHNHRAAFRRRRIALTNAMQQRIKRRAEGLPTFAKNGS
jgi:hypothetical protein